MINIKVSSKKGYTKIAQRTRGSALIEASFVLFLALIVLLCIFEVLRYQYIKVLLERAAHRGVSKGAWQPLLDSGIAKNRRDAGESIRKDVVNYIDGAGLRHLFIHQGDVSNTASNNILKDTHPLDRTIMPRTIYSEGAYLKSVSRKMIDGFNGPIMIAIPRDEVGYSSAMQNEPFMVSVVLDLNPLTPFIPPIRIRAEAWGYREPSPGANEFAPQTCQDDPSLCDCLDTQRDPNTGICKCNNPADPNCTGVPPTCANPVGSLCNVNDNWGIVDSSCNCSCPQYAEGDMTLGCKCKESDGYISDGAGQCICSVETSNSKVYSECNNKGGFFNRSTCDCVCMSGAVFGNGICACPADHVERKRAGYSYVYCCPTSGLCTQAEKDQGKIDDFGDGSCRCDCPIDKPYFDDRLQKCVADEECGSECP